jgi:hypothetical protein
MKNKRPEDKKEVIRILRVHNQEIKEKFKIKDIGIFGSFIRGEQRRRSDIDILVEFEKDGLTFDNYMDLKFYLEEILNSKVDLVTKTGIREELRQHILSEVSYV